MSLHGFPDHSGGPEMYDDGRPGEPCCEVCGTEDDVQPYGPQRNLLCVAHTAEMREDEERDQAMREEEDATPVPVIDPPTAPVAAHVVMCDGCRRLVATVDVINGAHVCKAVA